MNSVFDSRTLTFLVSIVLAIGLWFHVHGEFQIRRTLAVKINYLRTEEFVAKGARERNLNVEIRGPAVLVQRLLEQQHMVDIDLANFRPGPVVFGNFEGVLRKEFPREVDIISVHPREIQFEVDRFATVTLPVAVQIKGEPQPGFEVVRISIKPEQLTIGGAQSVVNELKTFAAGSIDVSQLNANKTFEIEADSPAPDYWIVGTKKVTVAVELQEQIVRKELEVAIQMLNTDFKHTISPEKIKITIEGPYSLVQNLTAAEIEAYVDGETLRAGLYRRPIAIKAPEGVKLLENSPRYFSIRLWKTET